PSFSCLPPKLSTPLRAHFGDTAHVVEILGVCLIERLHFAREANLGGLDEQVVMVRHQDAGVQKPPSIDNRAGEQGQETATIGIVAVDVVPLVAAAGDMQTAPGNS